MPQEKVVLPKNIAGAFHPHRGLMECGDCTERPETTSVGQLVTYEKWTVIHHYLRICLSLANF